MLLIELYEMRVEYEEYIIINISQIEHINITIS